MYFTYVLKSSVKQKSYVGFTSDINRRLKEHNSGKHSYTKRYMPWVVVYTEIYEKLIDAKMSETYFKTAAGRRFLKKNIFKN